MKLRIPHGRDSGVSKLILVLLPLLLNGCLGTPPGDVEKHWGQAYKKTMQAQIPDPPPDTEQGPSYATDLGEVDAVTSDLILENYQTDVKRAPVGERGSRLRGAQPHARRPV